MLNDKYVSGHAYALTCDDSENLNMEMMNLLKLMSLVILVTQVKILKLLKLIDLELVHGIQPVPQHNQ